MPDSTPHSELARAVLRDQKGHRMVSLRLAQEVLDLEEQYEGEKTRAKWLQDVVDEAEATERSLREQFEAERDGLNAVRGAAESLRTAALTASHRLSVDACQDVTKPMQRILTQGIEQYDADIEAILAEASTPAMSPCPTCDGVGAQAGAHTERVEPCPTCDGTGRKKVEATG